MQGGALRMGAWKVAFQGLDAPGSADARAQRQRRRAKRPFIERDDPGERVLEHQAQDLVVAFRREDVCLAGHVGSRLRASAEFLRP